MQRRIVLQRHRVRVMVYGSWVLVDAFSSSMHRVYELLLLQTQGLGIG
jgi:hypothetical protein